MAQPGFTLLRVLLGDSSKLSCISPTNQFQNPENGRVSFIMTLTVLLYIKLLHQLIIMSLEQHALTEAT